MKEAILEAYRAKKAVLELEVEVEQFTYDIHNGQLQVLRFRLSELSQAIAVKVAGVMQEMFGPEIRLQFTDRPKQKSVLVRIM